jgi:hypothetical protein
MEKMGANCPSLAVLRAAASHVAGWAAFEVERLGRSTREVFGNEALRFTEMFSPHPTLNRLMRVSPDPPFLPFAQALALGATLSREPVPDHVNGPSSMEIAEAAVPQPSAAILRWSVH